MKYRIGKNIPTGKGDNCITGKKNKKKDLIVLFTAVLLKIKREESQTKKAIRDISVL